METTQARPAERAEHSGPASIPRAGNSLLRATEERAVHVRAAAQQLAAELRNRNCELLHRLLLAPRLSTLTRPSAEADVATELAWSLVAQWLLGVTLQVISPAESLADAESWFLDSSSRLPRITGLLSERGQREAGAELQKLTIDSALVDLLPHILEAHGPGARSTVLRDPSARHARTKRKAAGVFYTPADVAQFIVQQAIELSGLDAAEISILDPACGTGVFLLSALSAQRARSSNRTFRPPALFGIDISSLAVNSACYVILCSTYTSLGTRNLSPWSAWHAIRLNFASADALAIDPPVADETTEFLLSQKRSVLCRLIDNEFPEPDSLNLPERAPSIAPLFNTHPAVPLDYLFPELRTGADIVVGNPPYSKLGQREDFRNLQQRFQCLSGCRGTGTENVYPMFIEMLWRLGRSGRTSGGMVVPMSLAYHGGAQYESLRAEMGAQGGEYRFAFFDREPNALFGEEVKTRNAIVHRFDSSNDRNGQGRARFYTGPLQRWTSRTRHRLFQGVTYTSVPARSIATGIPKFDGQAQAAAYCRLTSIQDSLTSLCGSIGSAAPSATLGDLVPGRLFIGNTAYSFVNVFRCHREVANSNPMAEGMVHMITAKTERVAQACFAILSSHLVYWYWHVLGDGFHLPRWFLCELPFGCRVLSEGQIDILAELGEELWESTKHETVVSVNGGRLSIAYRPTRFVALRRKTDEVLLEAAGIAASFEQDLLQYVRAAVLVDEDDGARLQRIESRPDWFAELKENDEHPDC